MYSKPSCPSSSGGSAARLPPSAACSVSSPPLRAGHARSPRQGPASPRRPAHRAGPPVVAVGLVVEPLEEVRLVPLQVLAPHACPVLRPLGIRRQGVVGDHEIAIVRDVVVLPQVATPVVAVVGVAVVGEVH